MAIGESLNTGALEEASQRCYWHAAQDTILACRLSEVTKYFDFASLSVSTIDQRRSLNVLTRILPNLSSAQRDWCRSTVSGFRSNRARITQLAQLSRLELLQFRQQQGQDVETIEAVEKEVKKSAIRSGNILRLADYVKASLKRVQSEDVSELFQEIRLGCVAAIVTDRKIDEVKGKVIQV
jgi:hypothetical protein